MNNNNNNNNNDPIIECHNSAAQKVSMQ